MINSNSIETIAAQATASGRGGVGIVRVSGPKVRAIIKEIMGELPQPRYAKHSSFKDIDGATIDIGLTLFFSAPHSFTGEDVAEFHCHGGAIVIDSLLQRVINLGARIAKPGEFTERAFLNDKIDLTQAEAIADLIDASSVEAARAAVRSLQGEFSNRIRHLVDELIELRLYVEAAIDFPEEEIDFLANSHIVQSLHKIQTEIAAIISQARQGALLREGLTIVIAGRPNAGKSSLLNCLSGRDSAIVTATPGTTRDLLKEYIDIDGIPLHIIDTAGLHQSDDLIEQEGIRRAWEAIKIADHILLVADGQITQEENPYLLWPEFTEQLSQEKNLTLVINKIDLLKQIPEIKKQEWGTIVTLSAKTRVGIDLLRNHLKECAGYQANSEGNFTARRRHIDALTRAQQTILNAIKQLQISRAGELCAEELRQAQYILSEITGEFSSDDLLGKIFASFCIGK